MMRSVLLRVETPRDGWCHHATTKHPGVDVRVLSCFPTAGQGLIEEVEFVGRSWREALATAQPYGRLENVEVLEDGDNRATVRLRVNGCPFVDALAEMAILPRLPFRVIDGHDEVLFLSSGDEASRILRSLGERGVRAYVVRAGPYEPRSELTRRQQEILEAAVREGFYSYPRRITLTELARRLDVAKSTLSQALVIIERAVMRDFVSTGRHDEGTRDIPDPGKAS